MDLMISIYPYHCMTTEFKDLKKNISILGTDLRKYFGRDFLVTPSGRYGISAIMKFLRLKPKDEIYITTSSESTYVTSCVTSTIFNNCKPSRVLTKKTKAIFIIHEFGVPNPRTEQLVDYAEEKEIVVIEDCAHTFDSKAKGKRVGTVGDYAIYSLTKIFPLPEGGVVTGPDVEKIKPQDYDLPKMKLLEEKFSGYMPLLDEFSRRRIEYFRYLQKEFRNLSLKSVFEIDEGTTPYFFPLDTLDYDPEPLKKDLVRMGIECGVWWGMNAILLPNHPLLMISDLDYMVSCVKNAVSGQTNSLIDP